jgi:hypothetical protein
MQDEDEINFTGGDSAEIKNGGALEWSDEEIFF